jgi:hypothetical protein
MGYFDVEKLRRLWRADHEIGENGTEENEALRDYMASNAVEIIALIDSLHGVGVREFMVIKHERDALAAELAKLKGDGK